MRVDGPGKHLPRHQAPEMKEDGSSEGKLDERQPEKNVLSQDDFRPSGPRGRYDHQRGEEKQTLRRDEFHRGIDGGPEPRGPHRPDKFPSSRQDPAALAAKLFAEMDKDGNGSITREEMEASFKARLEEPKEQNIDTAKSSPESLPADPGLEKQEDLEVIETPENLEVVSEPEVELQDPLAIKEQVLAQLTAMQQDTTFESLSEDEKQALADTLQAVGDLDVGDSEFLPKLSELLYGESDAQTT